MELTNKGGRTEAGRALRYELITRWWCMSLEVDVIYYLWNWLLVCVFETFCYEMAVSLNIVLYIVCPYQGLIWHEWRKINRLPRLGLYTIRCIMHSTLHCTVISSCGDIFTDSTLCNVYAISVCLLLPTGCTNYSILPLMNFAVLMKGRKVDCYRFGNLAAKIEEWGRQASVVIARCFTQDCK